MIEELERIWNESAVAYSNYHLGIFLELPKTIA